jgi:biopolymer transport protein ExbD
MSHGNTDRCEPNFTPLLDLVLQLVMFFMISANFVLEQTSVEIKLPKAIAAKALEKSDEEVFFLNVTEQGIVRLTPDQREGDIDSLDNEIQVRDYKGRQAEREKKRTGKDQAHRQGSAAGDSDPSRGPGRPIREDLRDHARLPVGRVRESPTAGGAE